MAENLKKQKSHGTFYFQEVMWLMFLDPPEKETSFFPSPIERRARPRWKFSAVLFYQQNDNLPYAQGRFLNVHLHGLCLLTPTPLLPQSRITVCFSPNDAQVITLKGQVVWQSQNSEQHLAGLHLEDISEDEENLFFQIIFTQHQREFQQRWFEGWK